ncbi:hypothetical protein N3K66_006342 [Trichothecium roseum]|uniref:Uncharacterized protein n=1 Tax=Trichothecium roseum TaxID=47278 RepID=A0ACC0UV32_9HYPO|nr:hypothetical protein N3K66_006342 [Trichothecium roseum]
MLLSRQRSGSPSDDDRPPRQRRRLLEPLLPSHPHHHAHTTPPPIVTTTTPDLSDVYFTIRARASDREPLLEGSLLAFLAYPDARPPIPRHYFTFAKFRAWVDGNVPACRGAEAWVVLAAGYELTFSEEASWHKAMRDIERLLLLRRRRAAGLGSDDDGDLFVDFLPFDEACGPRRVQDRAAAAGGRENQQPGGMIVTVDDDDDNNGSGDMRIIHRSPLVLGSGLRGEVMTDGVEQLTTDDIVAVHESDEKPPMVSAVAPLPQQGRVIERAYNNATIPVPADVEDGSTSAAPFEISSGSEDSDGGDDTICDTTDVMMGNELREMDGDHSMIDRKEPLPESAHEGLPEKEANKAGSKAMPMLEADDVAASSAEMQKPTTERMPPMQQAAHPDVAISGMENQQQAIEEPAAQGREPDTAAATAARSTTGLEEAQQQQQQQHVDASEHGSDGEGDDREDQDNNDEDDLILARELPDDQPLTGCIAPTQQILYHQKFLTEAQWAEVCVVLDHPRSQRSGGKILAGTRQGLLVHQMAFIVRAMKSQLSEPELDGLLVADNVGLGKSICALGLFAVSSLVMHNARHVKRHPEMHLDRRAAAEKRPGLVCPAGNPYGIQCVCVPDGISRDYLRKLVGGPSVIAVPASNLDAWAARIRAYFRRRIHVRDSLDEADRTVTEEVLVEPVSYRDTGQLTSIPLDDDADDAANDTDLERRRRVRSRNLMAKVVSPSHEYRAKNRFRADAAPPCMSYDQLRQEAGDKVDLRFEAPPASATQFRFLMLMSYQALSQNGSNNSGIEKLFSTKTRIRRPKKLRKAATAAARGNGNGGGGSNRNGGIHVKIPFTIAATLFIYDESHLVVNRDSVLFKSLRRIQELSRVDERRRTRWFFMTATPFSHSPYDVASCLEILISDPDARKSVLGRLPEFAARFRQLQNRQKQQQQQQQQQQNQNQVVVKTEETEEEAAEDTDTTAKFARDFANFMRPFTVARDWGSPYLDTRLQDERPGITHRSVEVSVPPELEAAVGRLGERCRRRLSEMRSQMYRDLRFDDVAGATVFTQFFSAGIMPGIAAAAADGGDDDNEGSASILPASVKQIDDDFRLGEESVLFKARHRHEGHEWTKQLARIIHEAHGGGTASGTAGGTEDAAAHGGGTGGAARPPPPPPRPRHILLIAQTPSLVAHLVHWIRNEPTLRRITKVTRIFQNVTPRPASRDTFLRAVAAEAASPGEHRSYVVATTPRLVGVGIDMVFCSYVVQFGELFSNREREQLVGRVHRPGQSREIRFWHIRSTHETHAAVRERNAGRSVMLSEFGLAERERDITAAE